MNGDQVLDTALRYIQAGFPCHPCYAPDHEDEKKAGKSPKVTRWQNRRLTADEFRYYYRSGDNLGLITGRASGCVVVDIDPRNGGGSWFEAHRDDLYGGIVERTGGGGWHVFFRYPEGRSGVLQTRRIAPGVEVLADGGHQVVTWPSVHKTGVLYEWELGGDFDLVAAMDEAAELPEWLAEQLAPDSSAEVPAARPTTALTATDADLAQVRRLLTSYPAAVTGDQGDQRTFATACVCRDYGLDETTAYGLMREVYNPRCSPPWTDNDLREKVRNAYRYAKGAPGEKSAAAGFEPVVAEDEPAAQDAAVEGAVEPRLKDLLKQPTNFAKAILAFWLADRIKIHEEVVYHYSPERQVWFVLTDPQFQALIMKLIRRRWKDEADAVLKPRVIKELAQAIRLLLEAEPFDPTPNRWLSDDGRGRNCVRLENGILDLQAGTLQEHTEAWFSFTRLPYRYDPQATCPAFKGFLDSIWPDDADARECLQLWFGFLLLSQTKEQKFALLMGASRAGKGVLTRLMQKLVGRENTAASTMSSLGSEHGLAHLVGKSLAIFGDVVRASGTTGEMATERLISIIGMDPQVINPKNAPLFTTTLAIKIVIACNDLPQFINSRDALSNRMILFPFTESFAGREDPALEENLEAELPGVLNWALEGARRVMVGERLRMPRRAEKDFTEIRKQMDPMFGFIADCIEFHDYECFTDEFERTATPQRVLYEAYREWCTQNGHHPLSHIKFSTALKSRAPKTVLNHRSVIDGRKVSTFYNLRMLVTPGVSAGFDHYGN